ncbi:SCO0607 family lipoprotein [Streptomyces sp. NPDC048566]|uniref:SCO0607 family lipoprotein n=1 Tax=Streptomyces sp. NPDC048566 TaxID=3365569 RepID=UPI00371127AE
MNVPRTIRIAAPRRARSRVLAAALTGTAAVAALTGCAGFEYREAVCGGGEYPALTVGGTGSACFSDKEEPSAGYTRYPAGKVPKEVDDKWDVYWRTHTVDEDGKITSVPAGS